MREVSRKREFIEGKRSPWRFKYRCPSSHKVKYLICTPERFAAAGIALVNPDLIRERTRQAEGLVKRLQTTVIDGLAQMHHADVGVRSVPLSEAIEFFFQVRQRRGPERHKTLARTSAGWSKRGEIDE